MFLDLLPKQTRVALETCRTFTWLKKDWYLAGGTALSIQCGHRISVDLDFFTKKKEFSVKKIEDYLLQTGKWKTTLVEKSTLYGILLGAKVSFISNPSFKPSRKRILFDCVFLLDKKDIALMKMIAISQRGSKRDFYDLYWYCLNTESLEKLLNRISKQYSIDQNHYNHLLKSFVYFNDAENEPDPNMVVFVQWKEVKKFFIHEVEQLIKVFL